MADHDPKLARDVALGRDVLLILGHRWFEKQLGTALDRGMAELLIAIFVHSERGTPLSKKLALQFVAVSDVKTARKYLARGIELEWIEAVRSEVDKRVELLRLSPAMREVIREELRHIAEGFARPEAKRVIQDWGDVVRAEPAFPRFRLPGRLEDQTPASKSSHSNTKKK